MVLGIFGVELGILLGWKILNGEGRLRMFH